MLLCTANIYSIGRKIIHDISMLTQSILTEINMSPVKQNYHLSLFLYRINLAIRYDDRFYAKVANYNKNTAVTRIKSIINLARPYFKWTSLGSKINLNILEIKYITGDFQLGSNPGSTL